MSKKTLAPVWAVTFEDTAHNSNASARTAQEIQEGATTITITAVGHLTCRDSKKIVLSQSGDTFDDEPRYRDHMVIPKINVRSMKRLR